MFVFLFIGINLRDWIREDIWQTGVSDRSNLDRLAEQMSNYIVSSRSDNTAKSYHYSFKPREVFIKNLKEWIFCTACTTSTYCTVCSSFVGILVLHAT